VALSYAEESMMAYVKPFRYNTGAWQTERWMDRIPTAYQ